MAQENPGSVPGPEPLTPDEDFRGSNRRSTPLFYGAVLLASLLVHLLVLWIPFHFDDFHHISENPALMNAGHLARVFTDPSQFTNQAGETMYRPVLMASHNLTYLAAGMNPAAFHLVNLVLHLANTAIVLSLFSGWLGRPKWAAAGALFWSVAAVQQITVGYASARSSLLAAFFMLLALRVTEGPQGVRLGRLIPAALFFALALLTKEIAFVLPLLVMARDLTLGRGGVFRFAAPDHGPAFSRLPLYLALFALIPAYLVARWLLLDASFGTPHDSRFLYLLTQSRVFFWYMAKSLFPANISLVTDFEPAAGWFSAAVILPGLGVLALLLAAALTIRKRPFFGFGVLWMLIALAPTSSLVPLNLTASLERMYLPLLGLVVIGAGVWSRIFDQSPRQKAAAAALAVIILANGAITVERHAVWLSTTGLMKEMVKNAPGNSLPLTWLGIMEMQQGDTRSAKKRFLRVIQEHSSNVIAHQSLATAYKLEGNDKAAAAILNQLMAAPDLPESQKVKSLVDLAIVDLNSRDLAAAYEKAARALEIHPGNADANYAMGRVLIGMGEMERGRQYFVRALEIYPDHLESELQLGIMALNDGDLASARLHLEKVRKGGLEWSELYVNLGLLAGREKDTETARLHFEKAIELNPDEAHAYLGLGMYFAVKGDLVTAAQYLETALTKKPGLQQAREILAKVYVDLAAKDGQRSEEYQAAAALVIRELLQSPDPRLQRAGRERKQEWESIAGKPLP